MLSDDFRNYGAGASKLGHALKRDARALRHEHGIKMTTALVEMQVPPCYDIFLYCFSQTVTEPSEAGKANTIQAVGCSQGYVGCEADKKQDCTQVCTVSSFLCLCTHFMMFN